MQTFCHVKKSRLLSGRWLNCLIINCFVISINTSWEYLLVIVKCPSFEQHFITYFIELFDKNEPERCLFPFNCEHRTFFKSFGLVVSFREIVATIVLYQFCHRFVELLKSKLFDKMTVYLLFLWYSKVYALTLYKQLLSNYLLYTKTYTTPNKNNRSF